MPFIGKHTLYTEVDNCMETKLQRITEKAKANPNERFTSLTHLINKEMLKECHKEMNAKKATGVDAQTKMSYDENLEQNLDDLLGRMKRQAYKPQPARRVYIPKLGSNKMRPLGIPAYEDKLVQASLAKVMNAIYEADFLECSFGFRPNRSAHDALKVLNQILNKWEIEYVVDTDIKGFFDNVDHDWAMKFIGHRIADPNMQRLINRFLKAGIMESGVRYDTPAGTPQGGVCSPIIGNVYLHYVLDLWFEKIVRKRSKGKAYMICYADDSVFCFQYEEDARAFYEALKGRLAKFKLEVAEEKTKIIRLNKNGGNEEDSFDFLGFTHYVDKGKKIKIKTSKIKYRASLLRCKMWMKENRTKPTREFMKTLYKKLQGHINYYGMTYNTRQVKNFMDEVRTLIFKWLNRRSQTRSFNWEGFVLFMKKYPLPRLQGKMKPLWELGAGASYLCE